jgi:formate hydrogenlyase transcriptional activator
VIERAVILSAGQELEVAAELLPTPPPAPVAVEAARTSRGNGEASARLEEVERSHIVTILKQTKWRIDGPQGAARLLDMNPSTLRSRIKKLGIRRGEDDRLP